MKMKNLSALAAAASLAIAPAALQAADAPVERSAAPVEGESEVLGFGTIGAVVAIIAIGVGIYLLADDDDDDAAVSP